MARARLAAASPWRSPHRATRYFKREERVYTWGIPTARWRSIGRSLFGLVRGRWGYAEALHCADLLSRDAALETRMLGFELLGRFRSAFPPTLLSRIRAWLDQGRCDNWALTDGLCAAVLSPLLRRYPGLLARLARWPKSGSVWVRRAAAVGLVPLARRGRHLDAAYSTANALRHDREDLIQKSVGWLLREAGKTDRRRLEMYLRRHGSRHARTTVRYAIERFPSTRRRSILLQTRPHPYPSSR
jgi:3-methyladenine DNA glycosylase AlkD